MMFPDSGPELYLCAGPQPQQPQVFTPWQRQVLSDVALALGVVLSLAKLYSLAK